MSNIYILLIIVGFIMYIIGLAMTIKDEQDLYCEELGYKGDLKTWKNYAKTLTDSKPMQKELLLMDRERFKTEMYLLYNLTLKEV